MNFIHCADSIAIARDDHVACVVRRNAVDEGVVTSGVWKIELYKPWRVRPE